MTDDPAFTPSDVDDGDGGRDDDGSNDAPPPRQRCFDCGGGSRYVRGF
jgi:hypothetical protein